MGISFEGNEKFVRHQEPIATYGGYFTITQGGKEVGRVDATFDFRNMPEEHHSLALQIIMHGAQTMSVPVQTKKTDTTTETQRKKKWFGLF